MSALIPLRDGRFRDPLERKVLVAILTCERYVTSRVAGQRQTWLPRLPVSWQVVYVHGVPGEPASLVGDRLNVDCAEAYEHLPQKVSALMTWALEATDFDYLFKTDDDTYLDIERFLSLDFEGVDYVGQFRELVEPFHERALTYHYGKVSDPALEVPYTRPFSCPWATGGGYVLSSRAVEAIAPRLDETYVEHLFEDVMVGEAMHARQDLSKLHVSFSQLGVVNPLLTKDMRYLDEVLQERRELSLALRTRDAELRDARGIAPRVSVVMPVYNAPGVLDRAVQSVLDQSLHDLELILVDDASTDDTLSRLQALAASDPRIRVVPLEQNRGEGGARNAGIDVMRGDYLYCMDPDDEAPPFAIEHLLAAAESTGCRLVMGKYDWLSSPDTPRTRPTRRSPKATVSRLTDSEWLQGVPGAHVCNLYARQLLQDGGLRYPADLSIGGDQLFQVDALTKASDVALLDEVIYTYHHYNPDSSTKGALSLSSYLSDIEYNRRIARTFDAVGLRQAAVRRLRHWAYSIREYWVRIPESLDQEQVSQLFDSLRALLAEFDVREPWAGSDRAQYRHLLTLVMAGCDADAMEYIRVHREELQ